MAAESALTKITKTDLKILELLPEGWFLPERDVPFIVRCPLARCRRLEEFGMLESNIEGKDIYHLQSLYKKKETPE